MWMGLCCPHEALYTSLAAPKIDQILHMSLLGRVILQFCYALTQIIFIPYPSPLQKVLLQMAPTYRTPCLL